MNSGDALFFGFIAFLILFTAGEPDLLDAIIKRVGQYEVPTEMYPKEIEAAYEVCDNTNSKLKRVDATHGYNTVYCENGATFKLLSSLYMEEKE